MNMSSEINWGGVKWKPSDVLGASGVELWQAKIREVYLKAWGLSDDHSGGSWEWEAAAVANSHCKLGERANSRNASFRRAIDAAPYIEKAMHTAPQGERIFTSYLTEWYDVSLRKTK